jgi:futalosine hydrolase
MAKPAKRKRILVCAATARELDACKPAGFEKEGIAFAVTGVGIPLTLARLIPLIAQRPPELIVNVGIAGAYPGAGLNIGELVLGQSEVFGDIGMETPGQEWFTPVSRMPWADAEYRLPLPLSIEPFMEEPPQPLRIGRGCTVNACAGRAETGDMRRMLFRADFESMEGAAVALAAMMAAVPACEIRAVSNIAAERDMRPENIELALRNLGSYFCEWIGNRI